LAVPPSSQAPASAAKPSLLKRRTAQLTLKLPVSHRGPEGEKRLILMRHLTRHLYYFVSGKMQSEQLGEFCCSSRPLRLNDAS
jgi:hypothetical protein